MTHLLSHILHIPQQNGYILGGHALRNEWPFGINLLVLALVIPYYYYCYYYCASHPNTSKCHEVVQQVAHVRVSCIKNKLFDHSIVQTEAPHGPTVLMAAREINLDMPCSFVVSGVWLLVPRSKVNTTLSMHYAFMLSRQCALTV